MPVIKSAAKKLRQAKKRTVHNRAVKSALKKLLDGYKKKPGNDAFAKLSSALDKAAKKNIIHRNKAARLKSRLSALLSAEKPAVKPKTAKKTAAPKTPKTKTAK